MVFNPFHTETRRTKNQETIRCGCKNSELKSNSTWTINSTSVTTNGISVFFPGNLWLEREWKMTILLSQRLIINVAIFRLSMSNGKLLVCFFPHLYKGDLHVSLVYAVTHERFDVVIHSYSEIICINILFCACWASFKTRIYHYRWFLMVSMFFPSIFRFFKIIFGNYIGGKLRSFLNENFLSK